MPSTRQLRPGDRVLVASGTHYRAIVGNFNTDVAVVAFANPAGNKSGKAQTEIEFSDGIAKTYPTNAEWTLA